MMDEMLPNTDSIFMNVLRGCLYSIAATIQCACFWLALVSVCFCFAPLLLLCSLRTGGTLMCRHHRSVHAVLFSWVLVGLVCFTVSVIPAHAAAPPWLAGGIGFPLNIPDFYQHQKYGKTADGGQNSDDWEKVGGWCRPTSLLDGMFYWNNTGYAMTGYGGITANNTWLDIQNTEINNMRLAVIKEKASDPNPPGLAGYLKDHGHGVDKGAGPGKGLQTTAYQEGGGGVRYVDNMGGLKNYKIGGNNGTFFQAVTNEMQDGKQVQVLVDAKGAAAVDASLWWANKTQGLSGGFYHNVAAAGFDLNNDTLYFADPDSNKGNAKANAGIDWSIRPDPAVNARKYIPWDGTKDVVPLADRVGNNAPAGAEVSKYFFGAKMAADGQVFDKSVAANERYKDVRIRYLEVIQPVQIARSTPAGGAALGAGSPLVSNQFDVTAGLYADVDDFYIFPNAKLVSMPSFDLCVSTCTITTLPENGIDDFGNFRPYGGFHIDLGNNSPIQLGQIGHLSFLTDSPFDGLDALFGDASDPLLYRPQVYGAPELFLPDQVPEPITLTIALIGLSAAWPHYRQRRLQ